MIWKRKESSNRDGQQFHQYQQSEQMFQVIEHIKTHDIWHLKYRPLAWCRHNIVIGFKLVNGITTQGLSHCASLPEFSFYLRR